MNKEQLFVDAIEKVYALASSDDAWETGLNAISELLGASCTSFEIISKREQRPVFFRATGDFDQDMGLPYLEYYSKISPRVHSAENYSAGSVSYDYQIISEQEINRDEFYNDFVMIQGLRYFVAAHLINNASHIALFAAQRSPKTGHVRQDEIELAQRLLPHIQQSINLKFRLAEAQLSTKNQLEHLNSIPEAVIGLNAAGKVIFANDMAAKIFALKDGIECKKNNLHFSDRQILRRFDAAMASLNNQEGESIDLNCRDFIVRRPSNRSPFLAAIRPLAEKNEFAFMCESQAIALLFVRDPQHFIDLDIDALQASFNLSPQELDLASALDKGMSLQQVAQHREVAITTVRSQLYSLMSKVGVSKQANLVRVLGQYRRPFL